MLFDEFWFGFWEYWHCERCLTYMNVCMMYVGKLVGMCELCFMIMAKFCGMCMDIFKGIGKIYGYYGKILWGM